MKGWIYRIENLENHKVYIGKTYGSVEKRLKEHFRDSKKEQNRNRPLYKAFHKYGIEKFIINELEYCENCEEREQYWINYYNSQKEGYNATLGGDGALYFNYSDMEIINKYKETRSLRKVASFFKCDPDTIHKRLKNNNIDTSFIPVNRQKVIQKKEDIIINYFDSYTQAAQWIIDNLETSAKLDHIQVNISRCARGIRKSAYGYQWEKA
jgi:hypothetical protein